MAKERMLIEDALKHIHEWEYNGRAATAESLAGALAMDRELSGQLLAKLVAGGLIDFRDGRYGLTEDGREYALQVIRAHRLYETHLARETGLSAREWHHKAEKKEHTLSPGELDSMASRLGDPRYDPHGDPIPTRTGELPPPVGTPLLNHMAGWEGRVAHVEDEPEAVYGLIVASGLFPGMRIRVLRVEAACVSLNAEGRMLELTRPMAALVRVAELAPGERFDENVTRLSSLARGERASIVGLSPACRGPERSRLLDLGVIPGTTVEMDIESPSGNPTAYFIRGASIALRKDQAERVFIKKQEVA